ncbi:acetyltransferase [Gammaproteobacteria bacterium]|nr:acetyltransferase [Gammaproteobacteria bacterium]
MSKPSVILIGAGGHAHACIDVIEHHGQYQIAGLVGMQEEMHSQHLGYAVIATDAELPQLAKDYQYAFITVGQIRSPDTRIRLYQQAIQLGFSLPVIIAPTAHVSDHATIGAGTIVMHGAIVNAGARVGKNCIINTRALVEHDATVEDHCHISTGTILNGSVSIGLGSFVGSGSIIRDGITLGKNCVVGMGLCVRHNQADNTKFVGHDIS